MSYTVPLPKQKRPVHDEGSLLAFEYYRDMMRDKGYEPENNTLFEGDATCPEHLLWMCEEGMQMVYADMNEINISKYSRWLGFIQGCLISKGWTTVEAERDRTRPWFNNTGK
jgi:hypothetical protein